MFPETDEEIARRAEASEVEVEVVAATEEPEAPAQEQPQSHWHEKGFDKGIANIIGWMEDAEEQFILPQRTRDLILRLENVTTVDDLDSFSIEQMVEMLHLYRQDMQVSQQKILTLSTAFTRARTVHRDDVDFI